MSLDVLAFLEYYFERVKPVSTVSGEYRVSPCPICGNNKLKLYVNTEQEVFHCFVCDYGRGKKIQKLMRDMGSDPHDYDIDDDSYIPAPKLQSLQDIPTKKLPKEYRKLIGNPAIGARQTLTYLRNRGISDNLIFLFDIGYCFEGKYKNRVLIPYYEKGELMYFVTRDITDKANQKYLNAEWEKHTFLFNYERASNFNFVLIVEGVFDIMALPDHSICLLGKTISDEQRKLLSRFKRIYIVMDGDAIRDAYTRCEQLVEYFGDALYIVKLPKGKDPFDMKASLPKRIKEAEPYTFDSHSNFRIYNEQVNRTAKAAKKANTVVTGDVFDVVPYELLDKI